MRDEVKDSETGLSRGQFLAGALSAGGAAVASGVLPSVAGAGAATTPTPDAKTPPRTYTAGHFALELDGAPAGELVDASPLARSAVVIEEPLAQGAVAAKKHIGNVKYNEFQLQMGRSMTPKPYSWIQQSFDKSYTRKSGAVIAADFNYKELSTLTFTGGVLKDVTFPACDAASKEAAKMVVTVVPDSSDVSTTGTYPPSTIGVKQKAWLCSNFRLKIDNLDCSRVNKIESIAIKQAIVVDAKGTNQPGQVEYSDLVFELPEPAAGSIKDWFQDFIVNANNGDDKERNGTLEYLAPDNQTVLATLTFSNLGIYKGTAESNENNNDSVRRFVAEMYVERIAVSFSPAMTA